MINRSRFIPFHFLFICSLIVPVGSCSITTPNPLPEASSKPDRIGIAGNVMDSNNRPAKGAFVYAYRNLRSNMRGPADFEARVNEEGDYFLDLVEGSYFIVARKRQSGADSGPPRPGDGWALPPKNPVAVNPGEVTKINFTMQSSGQAMLLRSGAIPIGNTGFTGILVDVQNNPVPGAFVIAYPDTNYHQRPEVTSSPAGKDGRFQLFVTRMGKWCLAARIRTRGQPIAGELYGLLGKNETGCRNTEPGTLLDVGTIQLRPY